jgi:urease accessory protein
VDVIERLYAERAVPDRARGFARDTVTLGWEDRTQAHGRRRTDAGVEFGTSLPRGTVLHGGDCFVLDEARILVTVVEQPEDVFVVEPRSPQEWALYAYHIGNRHQPIMITERGLVCPDVSGVEALLQRHRMPYARATLPFTPAGAGVGHHH